MLNRFFLFILSSLLFLACNNNGSNDPVLSNPPYKEITDSIDASPKKADLYYKRGTLLFQYNNEALAEKDFRKAWDLEKNEDYALAITNILIKRNNKDAIAFLEDALKSLPESLPLQISLVRGYQQTKQYDKALAVSNNIISNYPNQLDALQLKAEILKEQNKTAEALQTLEVAYSYAPFDVELCYALAYEYAQTKNPKVINLTDSLIRMDTTERHAEPYHLKGVYYFNTGNTAKALSYFNQAIQHDYTFLSAYMAKGETLYNLKNYNEAYKTFQLASTVSPTYADAYFWIGKTLEAMNKKADAKLNYQRAYGLDKTFTEAKNAADRL